MARATKKFIFTEKGLKELKEEYDELIHVKRPAVVQRIQIAREFGDLSENSEYDAAKEEQSLLEARIEELEKVLKKVQLIGPKTTTDFVVIGSSVVIEVEGTRDEFMIVGTMEADPAKRMISNESPVGAALLGAKVGEVVDIITPIVSAKYKILEIK